MRMVGRIGDEDIDAWHIGDILRRNSAATWSAGSLRGCPSGLSMMLRPAELAPAPLEFDIQHGAGDIGIGIDDFADLLTIGHHPLERGAVGGLDRGVEPALVVGGQEILRHDREQKDAGADAGEEQPQMITRICCACSSPGCDHSAPGRQLKAVLAPAVEDIVRLAWMFVAQHAGAQHGRQGDGDQAGEDDRQDDGDGEFVQQPADQCRP